jgi:hypothetical protein
VGVVVVEVMGAGVRALMTTPCELSRVG